MAPSFLSLKSLRRRSRASFRTERSNDTSSEGSHSQGIDRTPTSGSLTPPSLGPHQSDPALNLQLKQQTQPQQQQTQLQQQQTDVPPVLVAPIPIQPRPLLANPNSDPSKRRSVSSMSGVGSPRGSPRLGSPTMGNNRSSIYSAPKPASPYAPRILNISDNTWVSAISLDSLSSGGGSMHPTPARNRKCQKSRGGSSRSDAARRNDRTARCFDNPGYCWD